MTFLISDPIPITTIGTRLSILPSCFYFLTSDPIPMTPIITHLSFSLYIDLPLTVFLSSLKVYIGNRLNHWKSVILSAHMRLDVGVLSVDEKSNLFEYLVIARYHEQLHFLSLSSSLSLYDLFLLFLSGLVVL